jgi:hypothetical protein
MRHLSVSMLRCICSFALYWGLFPYAQAQIRSVPSPSSGWVFEPGVHVGVGIQHSPKFKVPLNGLVWGSELNFSRQTTGRKTWEACHRRPDLGIAISYMQLPNPDVYGHAIGFLPNIAFGPKSPKRVYAHFRLGVGVAVLTKPYDPVTNPDNSVIGSYLNNMTSLRFGLGFKLSEALRLHTSVCLTHYSNGGSQLPNLGINTVSGLVGLYYRPVPYAKEMLRPDTLPRPRERSRRWHGVATAAIGRIERTAPGGPKHWLPSASLEVCRYLSPVNRLGLGFLWEYDFSWNEFLRFSQNWSGDPAAQQLAAQRFALYLSDEIFLGRFSMNFQAGGYFIQPQNKPKPYFARLGVRYYFRPADAPGFKAHIGVYLKAHNSVAEYVAFGIGGAW